MYPIDEGSVFLVEHNCQGTGVFNGTDFGRAKLTLGAGASSVRMCAFKYGTDANSLSVEFVNVGAGVTQPTTKVEFSSSIMSILLRRNAGAILATADEVAGVINQYFREKNGPITATSGGTGVVVPALGALSGGINPTKGPGGTIFTYERVNLNGGLFLFENKVPVIIRGFEAKLAASGPCTISFERVNLNENQEEIAGTGIPFFVWDDIDVTKPDISVNDIREVLHPFQAVRVTTTAAFTGRVRLDVRKESNFPYL
jgi:hypothetical protein